MEKEGKKKDYFQEKKTAGVSREKHKTRAPSTKAGKSGEGEEWREKEDDARRFTSRTYHEGDHTDTKRFRGAANRWK